MYATYGVVLLQVYHPVTMTDVSVYVACYKM